MISKSTAKFIKSLQFKKQRKIEQLFVVEGKKSVLEVLNSKFKVEKVFATEKLSEQIKSFPVEFIEANAKDLESIGSFKSNDAALALVRFNDDSFSGLPKTGYTLALDTINDPGNLGTIIRIADWYGINTIIASEDTVDLYNPKVISSSKGSFTRVNFHHVDLQQVLSTTCLPIYGALMDGENVHQTKFEENGILVMGNEANGISPGIESLIAQKVTIPRFGGAESLNVAMATAIICDNIFRSN